MVWSNNEIRKTPSILDFEGVSKGTKTKIVEVPLKIAILVESSQGVTDSNVYIFEETPPTLSIVIS